MYVLVRVLHVGLSNNPGGVENFVLNYHRNINRENIHFDYLDIYGTGIAFADEIHELGGHIYSVPYYKRHPILATKKLKKILLDNEFDVMHIHMQSAANLLPVIVGIKQKNIRIVCHTHSSSTPKGIARKILNQINQKIIRKLPVCKWACGKKSGEWMWGENFKWNDIIPNAIEYDLYKYDEKIRLQARSELMIHDDSKIIGFVGRFGSEKNIFFLIDVLIELLKISPVYKLLTVGGNELYDQFRNEIESKGLKENYYSVGIQFSAAKWYQAMDAFLLPSFFEGFPMVGVEAQASGLPCFFSDRIANEININGTAIFLPIGKENAAMWANAIHKSLEKQERVKKIPDEYIIEFAAKQLAKRYESIVG